MVSGRREVGALTHHLISFIGAGDYELAHYRFPDWSTAEEARFFGAALLQYLRHQVANSSGRHGVDRVVFIGTARSAFNALPEAFGLRSPALAGCVSSLRTAARDGDEGRLRPLLAELAGPLAAHVGLPCELRVLPDASSSESQIDAVAVIVEGILERDRVTLDVTHGLRHLPMLALTAALLLRHARKAEIAGIWYGALDLRQGREAAPAVDLAGLLEVANWVSAFAIYEHSGDFGPFAECLSDPQMTQATEKLREASFLERAARLVMLPDAIDAFTKAAPSPWPGMAGLFENSIRKRLEDVAGIDLYRRQRQLTYLNIRTGDPIRAAVYAYEALITFAALRKRWNPRDPGRREQISGLLRTNRSSQQLASELGNGRDWAQTANAIRRLRNAVAHADEAGLSEGELLWEMLTNRATFSERMTAYVELILPKNPNSP